MIIDPSHRLFGAPFGMEAQRSAHRQHTANDANNRPETRDAGIEG
jgi:hypothetical protein